MQKQLSPSVRIKYFDKEAVQQAIGQFVEQIKQNRPEVKKVVLFGSFVRGESVPGSDIDLLIILRESNLPLLERIPQYMPSRFPVTVDVFPYTEDELREMVSQGNFFVKKALQEGREIFPSGNNKEEK